MSGWLPRRVGSWVRRLLAAFLGIAPRRRIPIWALALLTLALEAVVYELCARAMGLEVPYLRVLLVMPLAVALQGLSMVMRAITIIRRK